MTKLLKKKDTPADDLEARINAKIAQVAKHLTERIDALERRRPKPADDDEEDEAPEPVKPTVKLTAEEKEFIQSLPDDAHYERMPPGVAFDGVGLSIEPNDVTNWTTSDMIEGARLLKVDLRPWKDQPRELRRRLYEVLASYECFPPDSLKPSEKAVKPKERPAAKKAVMPGEVEKGKDGLPLTSPVIGKHPGDDATMMGDDRPVPPHFERKEWTVKGKLFKLHLIAEDFRETVVAAGAWECEGFNCHDCVESQKAIDNLAGCVEYFEEEGKIEFEFPKGASEFAVPSVSKFVKKHEAKA